MSLPRTSPNPFTLTSTTCVDPYAGPDLRQLQRGLWAAEPGQDVEVRVVTVKIAVPRRVQDQPDLPLHQHFPRKGRQRRLPHRRIHCTPAPKQVISLGYTAAEAFLPFEGVVLRPFRDAGYAECSYKCTVRLLGFSCWTACEGWSTRSRWGGSTTRRSTWPSTSTTRRSKTATSTGSFPASSWPSARPPTSPSTSTMYPAAHAEPHLHAQRLRPHLQEAEGGHGGAPQQQDLRGRGFHEEGHQPRRAVLPRRQRPLPRHRPQVPGAGREGGGRHRSALQGRTGPDGHADRALRHEALLLPRCRLHRVDPHRPPRLHPRPAAELPGRDGETDAGGGRQQPHLEAGARNSRRKGHPAPLQSTPA
jgi:hypothetical protein